LYVPDAPARLLRRILRIGPDGREEPLLFEPRPYQNLAISPDGRRIVATIYERGASDLWLGEIDRGVFQRLTSEGGTFDPVWSRDGAFVYFAWARQGGVRVHRIAVDGSESAAVISTASPVSPRSLTRDGVLFAISLRPGGGTDILTIGPDGTARPWLATAAIESAPQLSPDDRYVTYQSNRSGTVQVYVRPANGGPPEQQVSAAGGSRPGWTADGTGILFTNGRHLYRVGFRAGTLSRPEAIYSNDRMVFARPGEAGTLALTAIEEERPLTTMNLVVGWLREVRDRQ
jgi:Tol biopolymer transport system component